MKNIIKTISIFMIALGAIFTPTIAGAHDADCPYCKLKLVQNTDAMDNEVVVKFGNKKIEYRCMFCVFADQHKFVGDVVVYAPSEKVGEPIIVKRTSGQWTAPAGTVFLNAFTSHQQCAGLSRAFTSRAAFDNYARRNNVSNPKPLTLAQFMQAVKEALAD
ncbi:MAG: hypothetical protein KF812_11120 [Fimbriimonadaceae bacterium]|nr:hypothetical protein [Fimbriimonadaceae bacterium]